MNDLAISLSTNIPAVIMLVLGFGLVVLEMCIPGFGVPGILGSVLLLVGIIIVAATPMQALLLVMLIAALLVIALVFCLRSAKRGRLSKSKLVLNSVALKKEARKENPLNKYKDMEGVTVTPLRPAGIAEFAGDRLNVISEGDFIPENSPVIVERVDGNVIAVKLKEE